MSGNGSYDYLFKLVIVGDMSVGKTSLLMRYINHTFSESYLTTIGCDFKVKTLEMENKVINLQMWDTSGQERFKALASSFYRNADGVIIVFDVTNPDSFSRVSKWLQDAEYFSGKYPIKERLLVGNKCDLAAQRAVTSRQGKACADNLGMTYIETSAKDNSNVSEAFENMCRRLLDSNGMVGWPQQAGETVKLDQNTTDPTAWSGYCCSYV